MIGNRLLLVLALLLILGLLGPGFVSVAPNRILSGQPLRPWSLGEPWLLAAICLQVALLLAVSLLRPAAWVQALAAGLALALLLTTLLMAGAAAERVAADQGPAARTSLDAGFWILVLGSTLAAAESMGRLGLGVLARSGLALLLLAGLGLLAAAGTFDALSIARELANRRDVFGVALLQHLALVAAALLPALIIGGTLGGLALRRRRLAGPVFAMLNLVQTIPSIALFGLLIGPLTALSTQIPALRELGISGIGTAPAVIALTLYALLPVARAVHSGFAGVPADVVEAARAMGMTARQIRWQVALPLALPVLLAGLRIVLIQLVGLTVVAALIGAGGLGTFVFQGLGQTATDLILLGALSAIALALVCDFVLRALTSLLTAGRAA